MNTENIVQARKMAEATVEDMSDGPLKVAAFQTILAQLLKERLRLVAPTQTKEGQTGAKEPTTTGSGTTSRLIALIEEGGFKEQRSLGEIKELLAQRGWHYRVEDLGTPLMRLVRKKYLRRSQAIEGGKKLWRYSNY